jgi:hypothetical protein
MADDRAWHQPDADTLGRALLLAEQSVAISKTSYVVCAVNNDGKVGFHVLPVESYANLRERDQHKHLTLLCAVLPGGKIDVYPNFKPFTIERRKG